MSMHKLTAGSGYDYLTRQVAALDSTEKGHTGLAAYYAERGEKPGVWIGAGMAGIDGLNAGDPVTAEQMRALFGSGMHPLADQRIQQLEGPDLTERPAGRDPARRPVQSSRRRRQPVPGRGRQDDEQWPWTTSSRGTMSGRAPVLPPAVMRLRLSIEMTPMRFWSDQGK